MLQRRAQQLCLPSAGQVCCEGSPNSRLAAQVCHMLGSAVFICCPPSKGLLFLLAAFWALPWPGAWPPAGDAPRTAGAGAVHGLGGCLFSPTAQGPGEAAPPRPGRCHPSFWDSPCPCGSATHHPAGTEPSTLRHLLDLIEEEEQPQCTAEQGCRRMRGRRSTPLAQQLWAGSSPCAGDTRWGVGCGHVRWGRVCWGHGCHPLHSSPSLGTVWTITEKLSQGSSN